MRTLPFLALLLSGTALARPVVLPVQGQLTDNAGAPIHGTLQVTFRLYPDPQGGVPLHVESANVDSLHGNFTLYLGGGAALDSTVFNLDQEVWLGIQIAGDAEMELIRVGWTPIAAFAAHAGDAESLDGYGSADFLPAGYRPNWSDIQNRPPGLDDGDNVGGGGGGTSYTIGQGLIQSSSELSVDPLAIYGWAEQVCYDSVTELRGSLDGVYLPQGWRPDWTEVDGKPPGFADNVDNDTTYAAGDGLTLTGSTFSLTWSAVEARARGVCYDNETELHAAISDDYLASSWLPDWTDLTNVPAGFADGVDDGSSYTAGAGLRLSGNAFSLNDTYVTGLATAACYDTEDELWATLDDDYMPIDYVPDWSDLQGVPSGFADGVDNGTSYTAGTGIQIVGTTISGAYVGGDGVNVSGGTISGAYTGTNGVSVTGSTISGAYSGTNGVSVTGSTISGAYSGTNGVSVTGSTISGAYTGGAGISVTGGTISADPAYIQTQARAAAYDSEAELTAALDDNYLPTTYTPAWASLSGKPAGFADNVDNDLFSTLGCPDGQSPIMNGVTWSCADLRTSDLTQEDLIALLDGADLNLGGGSTVDGDPVGSGTTDLSYGRLPTMPGTSCRDIKARVPSALDGLYLIDTDGTAAGSALPFSVYCDMTRDGGGWTLIMRTWYSSGLHNQAGSVGNPRPSIGLRTSPYKMADVQVRNVIGADNNFDILVDQEYWNTGYSNGDHEFVIVRNYTGVYTYTGPVAESSTPTIFESYRAADNAIAWRGRLGCGEAGWGINCSALLTIPLADNPLGAGNPQGGLGCLISMGYSSHPTWHHLTQGLTNTDTYIYICNSAQHTSSYSNAHRWWVR